MAHILAFCVSNQLAAIESALPGSEAFAWSDMFDPHHNAVADYYQAAGSYVGAGSLIPSSLGIACWNSGIMEKSLGYFSKRGHKTLGCGYYDDTERPYAASQAWLDAGYKTPNNVGIMYTTWKNDFSFLPCTAALKPANRP
jgi:hypothetical protein